MSLRRTTSVLIAGVVVLVALTAWLFGSRPVGGAPAAAATAGTGPVAQDRARDGVLVSGTGEVSGRPDSLRAQFGADARGATVGEALGRADQALRRIRASLLRRGVGRADLQTAGIEIYPRYDGNDERITGYQASQRLEATIRDLRRAGALIGAAVDAGGDAARLSGLTFDIEDDERLVADARRRAFADAKAKAALYADASGRGLGRVVSVTETVTDPDPTYDERLSAAADRASSPVVEPGRRRLAVTVTIEWAFG